MPIDNDTVLTAVYILIDDLYRTHFADRRPRRPGAKPTLSDSEVLTLALVGQWAGWSERHLVRYARRHWRSLFPHLLSQSAFNRRVRDLGGALTHLVPLLARQLHAADTAYEVVDGVAVRLLRRCRGRAHRLFGSEADIGKGGSDREWYYGLKLVLAVTAGGVITGFTAGPASTAEHWLVDALWCWRLDPTATPWTPANLPPSHRRGGSRRGPNGLVWPRDGAGRPGAALVVADRGYRGQVWRDHWRDDYGVQTLLADDYQGQTAATCQYEHAACRQVVETVNAHLIQTEHLHYPGARTVWGLRTRLAAKLAAYNVGRWLTHTFHARPFALATLVC